MAYLTLGAAGLLGGAYLACCAAEFLLWVFEREPRSRQSSSRRFSTSRPLRWFVGLPSGEPRSWRPL
ncbi:MAG TPA: hypothetical protein VN699_12200 [Pirellulales bacterium]|nr:hypothetical protein [Pirellulales bacterium]